MSEKGNTEQFLTYLPPDMASRVNRIQERHELKDSEIIRRLVAKGLQSDSRARHIADSFSQLAHTLGAVGVITAVLSLFYEPVSIDQSAILFMTFLICGFASALFSLYYAPEEF